MHTCNSFKLEGHCLGLLGYSK